MFKNVKKRFLLLIYTLTLNPALDYTVCTEKLVNGAESFSLGCGGKGINVSVMLKNLGIKSAALGFTAGFTGAEFERLVIDTGIISDFIILEDGLTRINIKIRDKTETDINVCGPCVPSEKLKKLYEKLEKLKAGDWLVISGSIAGGLPNNIYAEISEFAGRKGARVIIDAAGNVLTDSLYTKPFLIKPNREELSEIFGKEIKYINDVFACAEKLKETGAQNVMVTLGKEGTAFLSTNGERLYCNAANGKATDTVGAGDSAVAGFIAGYIKHGDLKEALKLSAAAGGATAFSNGIGSAELVSKLLNEINVVLFG